MKQKKLTFPVLLMIVAMVASITMSNIFITEAATGTLSKNTGSRHTVATSLSTKAEIYYTGNYAYSALSQVPGGTSSCLETVNSSLYEKLHTLMADTMTKSFSYTSLTTYWPNTDASDGSENASMIYSDSTSSSSYSREHVWPKSRASFKETDGGSDIQHLRPENSAINSTRSNYTFGNVRGVLSDYSTKTYEEKDVLYYSPSNDIVEVNDNVKGDIARILLYVYVRWEEPNLFMDTPNPVIGENDDQNDGTKVIESLDTLLEWCQIDPVDTWEMSRNDQCENLQGNRNVFIDYPEYAWLLFGKTVPEDLVTPSGDNKDSLSASYTQITSADEFSEGGSYVLVAANEGNYYALGNTIGTKIDSVVVSVADNTVTAESLPVWQIAATQNGVSLSNGTGFLSYGSTTDFKSSTESYEWNISQIATDGSFRFTASGSTSRAIAYSVSQNKFGAYATSNTSGYIFDFMVFKLKEEEIPSSSYTQITSADEFSEGGSYVLVAANEGNYYALGNTIGAKIDSVVVSVADNTVTAESLPVWQITATQNGVSLSNGTDFLSYGSTTNFKSSTESYEWNISQIATDGSFRFTASGSTSRAIAYSVSQNKFGAYATSNTSGYIFDFMVFKLKNSDTDTDTPGTTDPGNTEDEDLEDVLIGDVDQNGIINVRDVTKLQEYLVQEVVLTEQQKLCSDVNADNEINTRDVTLIQRYCVGLGYL